MRVLTCSEEKYQQKLNPLSISSFQIPGIFGSSLRRKRHIRRQRTKETSIQKRAQGHCAQTV